MFEESWSSSQGKDGGLKQSGNHNGMLTSHHQSNSEDSAIQSPADGEFPQYELHLSKDFAHQMNMAHKPREEAVHAAHNPSGGSIRQSPIDINKSNAAFDPQLESNPLRISYPTKIKKCVLLNTGHTWKLNVGDSNLSISGGPLFGRCQLDQIHAHWGGADTSHGSEHLVNSKNYAGELHFVHWNTSKVESIDVAALHPDGLAVIGVFFKIGRHHPELEKLTNAMKYIRYGGQEVRLNDVKIDARQLLPHDTSRYWTYEGSLTTPPYNDCVSWIVMKNKIEISQQQLDAMASLFEESEDKLQSGMSMENCNKILNNYRPVQHQSRVTLRSSFQPAKRTEENQRVKFST